MGCSLSTTPTAVIAPTEENEGDHHLIFTIDERLKLKEIWVLVKQNNLKKLGDDIMNKALEKNATMITYWQNSAFLDQGNNLTFSETESFINTDALVQQSYRQHGYQILEKIDQLIMILVTRVTTTTSNDSILKEYFHRVGESHSEYKMKQDHIDMLCVSIIECLKDLVYQNGNEWTIKHEMTWMKLLTLLTNQFLLSQETSTLSTKTAS